MANIKFAVIVGSDVAGVITIPEESESEAGQRFIAAYRSNPIIMETLDDSVAYGWTWDGTDFHPPVVS